MKQVERIGLIIVLIGIVWMIGKTIYGIGYRDGREMMETRCEDVKLEVIQETSDDLLVACEQKIDMMDELCEAKVQAAQEEILEMF